jgi:hypothetical protein
MNKRRLQPWIERILEQRIENIQVYVPKDYTSSFYSSSFPFGTCK